MTTRSPRRRGLAPLELVMLFPLLVALVVGILWVGKAGAARSAAIADARGVAWKQRDAADPGRVLKRDHDATASVVADARANPLGGRDPFAKQARAAEAATGAPFNPWTFEEIVFAELPPAHQEITPHRELLRVIGRRNPESLREYNRLIGRLGAAPIDPAKNAEVRRARPPAGQAAAARPAARAGVAAAPAVLLPAVGGLQGLATRNPYLAWWYEYEALVVLQGVNGATQLRSALAPPN